MSKSNRGERRKNRLVVEFTTSHPLNEREARQALSLLLERIDLDAKPVWANDSGIYGQKLEVKEFNKVLTYERIRLFKAGQIKGGAEFLKRKSLR